MPGKVKTTTCEKERVVGIRKTKLVGEGAEVGKVMHGIPVGITPKSCGRVSCAIVAFLFN